MSTAPKSTITVNLDNLDVYFIIDQSGSMNTRVGALPKGVTEGSKEDTRLTRYKYCEETIIPLANELAAHDDDGITFCFFNRQYQLHDNVTQHNIAAQFAAHNPGGGTALHQPLDEVLKLMTKRSGEKQQFAVVMTDGEPDSQDEVVRVLVDATKRIDANGKLCVLFLKVGDDPKAAAFLQKLDSDLGRSGAKFDIVAVKAIDDIAGVPLQKVVDDAFNN